MIADRLARIEADLASLKIDTAKILQRLDREVDPDQDDHERRLRRVEHSIAIALGGVGLLGAIGAWPWVVDLLR